MCLVSHSCSLPINDSDNFYRRGTTLGPDELFGSYRNYKLRAAALLVTILKGRGLVLQRNQISIVGIPKSNAYSR